VALVEDEAIVDQRRGDAARTHGERLPGELVRLLEANHLTLSDVDLFAVASGPGSFTGLRIGIATIQGLAFVGQRRVAAISALEALAQLGGRDVPPGMLVAAWMDAHRHDVFSSLARVTSAPVFDPARLVEIEGARVGGPAATLARWREHLSSSAALFVGDGAVMYREIIGVEAGPPRIVPPPPLAAAIGRIAVVRARRGETVDPAGILPLYVRRPDAELDRERKTLTAPDRTDLTERA
jgi:tRNA threonylcarbamoyladenosine biosynthesis protein TsaB